MLIPRKYNTIISYIVIFFQLTYISPVAFAQIVLGTPIGGNPRPYLDQTHNGLPKVNISTPTFSGVSHNVYKNFNVGKGGIILNNSAASIKTRLAGWIEGNQNLQIGKEAKVILNEVIGGSRSQLQGFLEVAGKKAGVVIANENGITCSGCGFINTGRITLTTGKPVWGALGKLDGFRINGGDINIGSQGIIASGQQIDLLSQYVNVLGRVDAKSLNIIAGNNLISYDNLAYSKITGDGSSNLFGIDSSALGGMYANYINLVATGEGVGVNIAGDLISSGAIAIATDGTITNKKTISAGNQLAIEAKTIDNQANLIAGSDIELTSSVLTNSGQVDVSGNGQLNVNERFNNSGSFTIKGDVAITGQSDINNSGNIKVNGDVSALAGEFDNSGDIQVGRNFNGQFFTLDNSGDILSQADLTVSSTNINNSGNIQSSGALSITNSGSFTNYGSLLSRFSLSIQSATAITNNRDALIASLGDMVINSASINNVNGNILHLGEGSSQITAQNAINNALGTIESQGSQMSVTAGEIDNSNGEILHSNDLDDSVLTINVDGDGSVDASGILKNIGGKIAGNGQVEITAKGYDTDNSVAVLFNGNRNLTLLDQSGASSASGNVGISNLYDANEDAANAEILEVANDALETAQEAQELAQSDYDDALANKSASESALTQAQAEKTSTENDLVIKQAELLANPSDPVKQNEYDLAQTAVSSANDEYDQAQDQDNIAGDILTTTTSSLQTANNTLQSAQTTADVASVMFPQDSNGFVGEEGESESINPEDVEVVAPEVTLNVVNSQISALGNLTLTIGDEGIDNRMGEINSQGEVTIQSNGLVIAGQINSTEDLQIQSDDSIYIDQKINGQNINLTAENIQLEGRVLASEQAKINTEYLNVLDGGHLNANKIDISGRESASLIFNNNGLIQSVDEGVSIIGKLGINSGTITSEGAIDTNFSEALENRGVIFSKGSQNLIGKEFVNNQGRIYSQGDIVIEGDGSSNAENVFNYAGRIEAHGNIDIKSNKIVNRSIRPSFNARALVSKFSNGNTFGSRARDTLNNDGKKAEILAGDKLTLSANTIKNDYGYLSGRNGVTLDADSLNNLAYGVIETSNVVQKDECFSCHHTVSYYDSWGGVIESGGDTNINVANINNQTIQTRDGFADVAGHSRITPDDQRANSLPDLVRSFIDRTGGISAPVANFNTELDLSAIISANLPNDSISLFESADPDSPYLIQGRRDFNLSRLENNSKYTNYNNFLGSNYMLERLGMLPTGYKLLGDAWFETQLVQEQLYALTGRKYLVAGTDSDYDLMKDLMDAGLAMQSKLQLTVGDPLSAEQQAALTENIIWQELQEVTDANGNVQQVLVPKVYLAKVTLDKKTPGALIAGVDVNIETENLANNGGNIIANDNLQISSSGTVSSLGGGFSAGKSVSIISKNIDLTGATVKSDGWLKVESQADTRLVATDISAKTNANIKAGGNLDILALRSENNVKRGDGTARDDVRYEVSTIKAGENLVLESGGDITVQAADIEAGKNAFLKADDNVDLQALTETSDYSYYNKEKRKNKKANKGNAPKNGKGNHKNKVSYRDGTIVHKENLLSVKIKSGGLTQVSSGGDINAQSVNVKAEEIKNDNYRKNKKLFGIFNIKPNNRNKVNASKLVANKGLFISAGESALIDAKLFSGEDTNIAAEKLSLSGALQAKGKLELSGTDGVDIKNSLSAKGIEITSEAGDISLAANDYKSGDGIDINAGGALNLNGSVHKRLNINAQGDVNLVGFSNVTGSVLSIKGEDVNIGSLGYIAIAGGVKKAGGGNEVRQTAISSTITGNNINLTGGGNSSNILLNDIKLTSKAETNINTTGNLIINPGTNYYYKDWQTKKKSGNMFRRKTTVTNHVIENTTTQASEINAGNITINTGGDAVFNTVKFNSGKDVNIDVGGNAKYLATQEIRRKEENSKTSRSFIGIRYKKESEDRSSKRITAAPTQVMAKNDVTSHSAKNTTLQATKIKAGGNVNIEADGVLTIAGVKESLEEAVHRKSENIAWQKQEGEGVLEIEAGGEVNLNGGKGIVVDIPEGDFKDTVLELTKDPKYTWINELEGRDDVDWQEVSLAFDEWDYAHEGLSPAGAAIIVIVVTIYTAGAASTLATALTQSAVLQASIAAGIVSIASTAAVSLANNKGNLGKVLKELGSEETIRSVATAMVTAGVVKGLSDTELMQTLGEGGSELGGGVGSVGSWSADFVRDLVNQAIGATINTAINGGSLADQLQSALLSAIANTAGEQGANLLHNQPQLLNKLGHALLGCATQSIQNKDCASGAVGAVAGELAAESMRPEDFYSLTQSQRNALRAEITEKAKLIGATIGFIGGLDPNAAAETAGNAAHNNGLLEDWEKTITEWGDKAGEVIADKGSDVAKLVEKLEIQPLADAKETMQVFLDEAASRGGLTAIEIAALGIIYAGSEALFPTNALDFVGGAGKGIKKVATAVDKGADATGVLKVADEVSNATKDRMWTSTDKFTSAQNSFKHWDKHKSEFPELQNSVQYVKAAKDFLKTPPAGTLTKTRLDGDVLRYNSATNTFGVMAKDGTPRTMFRPKKGIDYWSRQ